MRQRPTRQQTSADLPLPAPIGGWNARDALAEMEPTDAIQLDNWFPRPDRLVVRGGSQQWATGLGGSVDTLAEWTGAAGHKLLGAANGSIYNVTASGAVGAALGSGFGNNQWQTTMMSTAGGQFLLWFNGTDTPQKFDGTTLSANVITGSGLTATNLVQAAVHTSRVFMVEKGTLHVWYLPINQINGTALLLDMGQFCKKGGAIQAVGTWTVDGGESGTDDLFAILTTEGELLIYAGNDPSSASSWQRVGIFTCAKPIGRRCLLNFGADLILVLQDGVYEASSLMRQSAQAPALSMSDKIRLAFVDASASYQGTFGWDLLYYPNGQRLIVNVAQDTTGASYVQYVMNSISRAWCRMTGMASRSWALLNGAPYFGDANGVVWAAESGLNDNGTAIPANAKQAFTDLGVPGRVKHLLMLRPRFLSNGSPAVAMGADVDFNNTPYPVPGTVGGAGSPWNTSPWNTSPWSLGDQPINNWLTVGAIGQVIALKVAAQAKTTLSWFQTDVLAEPGGIL